MSLSDIWKTNLEKMNFWKMNSKQNARIVVEDQKHAFLSARI